MAGVVDPGTNLLFLAQQGPRNKNRLQSFCAVLVAGTQKTNWGCFFGVNSDVTSWKKKTHQRSENSRLLKSEFFKQIIATFCLPSCLLFQLNVVCVVHRSRVFFLEPPTFLQVGRRSIWSGATCPCLMEHQSLPTLQEVASTLLVTSGKVGTEVTIFCSKKRKSPKTGVYLLDIYLLNISIHIIWIYIYISY